MLGTSKTLVCRSGCNLRGSFKCCTIQDMSSTIINQKLQFYLQEPNAVAEKPCQHSCETTLHAKTACQM